MQGTSGPPSHAKKDLPENSAAPKGSTKATEPDKKKVSEAPHNNGPLKGGKKHNGDPPIVGQKTKRAKRLVDRRGKKSTGRGLA